jgi:hypothetical protein
LLALPLFHNLYCFEANLPIIARNYLKNKSLFMQDSAGSKQLAKSRFTADSSLDIFNIRQQASLLPAREDEEEGGEMEGEWGGIGGRGGKVGTVWHRQGGQQAGPR